MSLRRVLLAGLALGLVSVMACGGSRRDDGYVLEDGSYDAGVDSSVDVNDSDSGVEELKAIACPDVQEEVGGPYRIDDANDEHDGWCLYTVRVHDFFRFDGCRSTGDIAEYAFNYGGWTNVRDDQCWDSSILYTEEFIGQHEGKLIVLTMNREFRDEDLVLFEVSN